MSDISFSTPRVFTVRSSLSVFVNSDSSFIPFASGVTELKSSFRRAGLVAIGVVMGQFVAIGVVMGQFVAIGVVMGQFVSTDMALDSHSIATELSFLEGVCSRADGFTV